LRISRNKNPQNPAAFNPGSLLSQNRGRRPRPKLTGGPV
jgi:hypothetical protein